MVNIGNIGNRVPGTVELQQPQQVKTPTVDPRQVDSTTRVRTTPSADGVEAALDAPKVPDVALETKSASGAQSFAAQLESLGPRPAQNMDILLAQFLKLQILSTSMSNWDQAMVDWARSRLLRAAHDSQRSDRVDWASALYVQADSLHAQAGQAEQRAQKILNEAGVSRAEMETLYRQSVAAGGDGSDIVQRYRNSKPEGYDPEKLEAECRAIEKAMPHAREAASLAEQAGALAAEAGAIMGDVTSGLIATATIRAGTPGYQTMLKIDQDLQKIQNSIANVLSETRADVRLRRLGWVEVDQARNQVAKLVLQLVDKHQLVGSETLRLLQP